MKYVLLFVALVVATPAVSAHADADDRAAVQRLFLEGRLRDLDVLVADDDPWTGFALLVRDFYWRRGSGPAPAQGEGSDLLTQRRNWVVQRTRGEVGPYPTDESDPMPVLTALIQEREQRERTDALGSRIDAAAIRMLELDGDAAEARYFALRYLNVHQAFEANPEDLASVARAESIASRNAWLGFGAVLVLLLLSALFGKRSGTTQPE